MNEARRAERRPQRRSPAEGLGAGGATARADSYPRQPLDVLHYEVSISFGLDLDGPVVDRVSVHGEPLAFRVEAGRLQARPLPRRPGRVLRHSASTWRGRPRP